MRSFLALPKSKSGINVSRSEHDAASGSFPKLLELLIERAPDRLSGLDPADIEHYHRIRNTLYHEGTGLSVDQQYLLAYRSIAEVLIHNLFEVTIKPPEPRPSLEMLIYNWNSINKIVNTALGNAGFTSTYKWEEAFAADLLSPDDVTNLTELRMARNRLVHSDTVDAEQIAFWAKRSDKVLKVLKQRLTTQRRA